MAVSSEIQQFLFKYNLNGDAVIIAASTRNPDLVIKTFNLMDRTPKINGEGAKGQFNRIYKEILRERHQEAQSSKLSKDLSKWYEETQKARSNGYEVNPEKIKQQLDIMMDKGEISDKAHEYGYKGLKFLFGYEHMEEVDDIPF